MSPIFGPNTDAGEAISIHASQNWRKQAERRWQVAVINILTVPTWWVGLGPVRPTEALPKNRWIACSCGGGWFNEENVGEHEPPHSKLLSLAVSLAIFLLSTLGDPTDTLSCRLPHWVISRMNDFETLRGREGEDLLCEAVQEGINRIPTFKPNKQRIYVTIEEKTRR